MYASILTILFYKLK